MRARTIPVNPLSTYQTQVRSALTGNVVAWTEILTAAQRLAWNMYAQNVLSINPLGDPIMLSGQNWYIACNTPRQQAVNKTIAVLSQLPRVDDAPSMFDRGDFTTPTGADANTVLGIDANIDPSDEWASEPGAAMLMWMGRPRNASRNFFAGPWRLIGAAFGLSTPPSTIGTTPATVAAFGWPLVVGERIAVEVSVTRADGRLSTRRRIFDDVVAAS